MFWRHPDLGARQVAPKGCTGAGDRPRPQLLPKLPSLPSLERRASYCAGAAERSGASQASKACSSWWQERDTEPRAGAESPQLHLPTLHTVTSRAAQDRASSLRSLLLPPLRPTERSRESAWRRSLPWQGQDPRRSTAREDSLGSLLGEFLPSRFREFLHQLQQMCGEQPEPQSEARARAGWGGVGWGGGGGAGPGPLARHPAAPRLVLTLAEDLSGLRTLLMACGRPRVIKVEAPSKDCPVAHKDFLLLAQCPQHRKIKSVRSIPEEVLSVTPAHPLQTRGVAYLSSRGQPSQVNNFRKNLLHQPPSQGHQKGNPSQVTTGRNTKQCYNTQAPKVKVHNSSGEGLGFRRRCCPYRVRFADETVQDSTLRYLERHCTVPSNIKSRTVLLPELSDQVSGNVQKWLQSLPKAQSPRAKEEARTSAWCWDCPHLHPRKRQGYFSEDASMRSRLPGPFIPKATTQRQRGSLRPSLDTLNFLDQESFLPNLVLQSILRRGRPKSYQLLLPSTILQQAQR